MNWIFGTTYLPKKIFYNLALISDYLILTIKNQNLATLIYLPGIRATGPSVSQFEDWNTTSLPTSFKHIAFTIGKSILMEHLYSSCFYLLCFYMTNLILFLHIANRKISWKHGWICKNKNAPCKSISSHYAQSRIHIHTFMTKWTIWIE